MGAIELAGVTKRFGDVVAVSDLDLVVERGEIFGFLGPNGAGKTTTIDMLLDFVRPTSGEIQVLGRDAASESVAIRKRIGVLPERMAVYERLTGRKHVEFAIASKGSDDDPRALMERVGLGDAIDRKAGTYSKGMTQRLGMAMALVGDPEVLILDEPSTGLDPNGAMEMRGIVHEEVDRGATVFFSSHLLDQVEAVADRVGILQDGDLVALDSVSGLRQTVSNGTVLAIEGSPIDNHVVHAVRAVEGVEQVTAENGSLRVSCETDAKTRVLSTLESSGVAIDDFRTEELSLEQLFRTYTTQPPKREVEV